MASNKHEKTLIYAPPHFLGNMGDRIVTKVLYQRIPTATYLYDNLLNYLFANKSADKIYLNPHRVFQKRKMKSITKKFSKLILLGMDGMDGFYSLRESLFKIELAIRFAQAGQTSWIINFSWNSSDISQELMESLQRAQNAGVVFIARDTLSQNRLAINGISVNVRPDLGFLITELEAENYEFDVKKENKKRNWVILSPSYSFGKTNSQILNFSELCIKLRARGYFPILYISVTNLRKGDLKLAKKINRQLVNLNHQRMEIHRNEKYLNFALLNSAFAFSARMHVAIVALAHHVTPYIFEYQGKSTGLLKDLEIGPLPSPSLEITTKEIEVFLSCLSKNSENLTLRIPILKRDLIQFLDQVVEA